MTEFYKNIFLTLNVDYLNLTTLNISYWNNIFMKKYTPKFIFSFEWKFLLNTKVVYQKHFMNYSCSKNLSGPKTAWGLKYGIFLMNAMEAFLFWQFFLKILISVNYMVHIHTHTFVYIYSILKFLSVKCVWSSEYDCYS